MKEQSVMSFDSIPLWVIPDNSPNGSKGSLATTIPWNMLWNKEMKNTAKSPIIKVVIILV